ncbi:hypothetical protein GM418_24245 [Maribellus comscasis]|uniref:Uncharacterized protein n=1 Tax=Maribellus comscasis TaxID=2681766 RepID=A0A6I6JZQ4_9BACT|nr:hypothetical protein [Maribellus comscasis]QGY46658.1 hypothetical protein GM418_24245 [Maribellus comscasis]
MNGLEVFCKWIDNNSQLVGWVQIEIDKSTGSIQVVNKNFSTEELIVAGK